MYWLLPRPRGGEFWSISLIFQFWNIKFRINSFRGTLIMMNSEWSWWRHQMETVSALLAICAGNSPVSGEFPAQRPVTRALMLSLIYARINSWVYNRKAGDLKRHPTHCDVIVMFRWRVVAESTYGGHKSGPPPIDDIFSSIFVNEKLFILIFISQTFHCDHIIDNILLSG